MSLVDYGVGNIFSVASALRHLGIAFVHDADGTTLSGSDIALVPGVAAFGAGVSRISASGQGEALVAHRAAGRPIVGLCLGAQMLLESSEEAPDVAGLRLAPGRVVALDPAVGRVPHQGWSAVAGSGGPDLAYFSHSFAMVPGPDVEVVLTTSAVAAGGADVVAAWRAEGLVGVQFHPERSGPAGVAFLGRTLVSVR